MAIGGCFGLQGYRVGLDLAPATLEVFGDAGFFLGFQGGGGQGCMDQ